MKNVKNVLLVLLMLASISNLKAQCSISAHVFINVDTASFYAHVDSGIPASYYWDFGNGDTSQSLNPIRIYSQSGNYPYCFYYSSPQCNKDTCNSVTINCAFNPIINSSQNIGLTQSFTVDNLPTGATFDWTICDSARNFITNSLLDAPVITFANYGLVLVKVIVTLPNGCVDSTEQYFNISNPCTANFINYSISNHFDYLFNVYAQDSLNASSYTYNWNFGDGTTSTLEFPTHTFPSLGDWLVCLTITGSTCTDSICSIVQVAPPLSFSYELSGIITKGSSEACSSSVFIIKDSVGFLSLYTELFLYPDSITCSGYYSAYLPEGQYYVKAKLDTSDVDYANFIPTYYGNVLNWNNASPINLTGNISNINIDLQAGINPGGPGFIAGWVTQGAGLAIGGNNGTRSIGDPIPNAQINLVTQNDVPVASTFSDANGRYTFTNLALGTYKVYAEEINKTPIASAVTLDANNPMLDDVNVLINSNNATTGINDISTVHVNGVYPNPTQDIATIELSLQQSADMELVLTNIMGSILQSRTVNLVTGRNTISLDLRNTAAGIYNLSLVNETNTKIIKLVKAK